MPRPLIIKIDTSVGNTIHTPSFSTDYKSPRIINKLEVDKVSLTREKEDEEVNTNSLVRNLINLYEQPNYAKTSLVKAKSLPHLAKQNLAVPRRSIVVPPTEIKLEPRRDDKFDFKKVWNKFETHSSTSEKVVNTTKTSKTVRSTSVDTMQEKAKQVLDEYRRIDESLWREHVVAFLKELCNVSDDEVCQENVKKTIVESEDHSIVTTKTHKVSELANLYERQTSGGPILTDPKGLYDMYFSNIKVPGDLDIEQEDLSISESESDSSANSQGSYNFEQPSPSSALKIMELRSYFEPNKGEYRKIDDESLPPSIIVLEDGQIAGAMEQINSMLRQVEKLQYRIESLSKGDNHEANKINEELIQTLLKLDDVNTFGEPTLQAQRKKAIQLVQTCIRQLMDKKRS